MNYNSCSVATVFSMSLSTLKKVQAELSLDGSQVVGLSFTETADAGEFQCNLCNTIRKKGNGNTNLLTHLETSHRDSIKDFLKANQGSKKGPMNAHVRNLSQDAKDYHDWIEWVVMGDHSFTFVENKYTRQHSRINSISRPTLREYMEAVSFTL